MRNRIIIGGDVCPVNRNEVLLLRGDWRYVWNDVAELLQNVDFAIANLECPLVETASPVVKNGPALCVSSKITPSLRKVGFSAINLANNHVMDHGPDGLESTLTACDAAGIATFGAGRNLDAARRPFIVTLSGLRIGFIGLADNERCLATTKFPGVGPLDPIWFVRTVREYHDNYDQLVVLVHGGNEGYPYPSPLLQETCRFLIEEGAGAVICQHSHCIGCYEKYMSGHIVYGQGNLLFDFNSHGTMGRNGLLTMLTFKESTGIDVDFIPVIQHEKEPGVRIASAPMSERILTAFRKRSEDIIKPGCVVEFWERFCRERRASYTNALFGYGMVRARLNYKGSFLSWLYSDSDILRINNRIQCMAHREVVLTILEQDCRRREKSRKFGKRLKGR